jgi:hypothetical protein
MKKTLLKVLALPILAGTLLFSGCEQLKYQKEQLKKDIGIKTELVQKESKKENGLESYFFQDQEVKSLSPIKGNIYDGDVEFQNLKIYTKGSLKEGGFGEEAEKVLQGAGQAEYFFPDGKLLHLVVFDFNSKELAEEMALRLTTGEHNTSPKFTFLNNNILSYISQPDIPSFQSEGMMSEADKPLLAQIINNYAKRTGLTSEFAINDNQTISRINSNLNKNSDNYNPTSTSSEISNIQENGGIVDEENDFTIPTIQKVEEKTEPAQTVKPTYPQDNSSKGIGLEKFFLNQKERENLILEEESNELHPWMKEEGINQYGIRYYHFKIKNSFGEEVRSWQSMQLAVFDYAKEKKDKTYEYNFAPLRDYGFILNEGKFAFFNLTELEDNPQVIKEFLTTITNYQKKNNARLYFSFAGKDMKISPEEYMKRLNVLVRDYSKKNCWDSTNVSKITERLFN